MEVGSNTPEWRQDWTCCASYVSGGGGNKGDERGSARRGRRAGGRVHKKKEMGGQYEDEAQESRADQMLGKGETHSAQRRRALHDATTTRKRGTTDPDTGDVCRARSEMTQHA